ncbi:hypothetical protein J7F01_28865 [Streptomyces sp. ISL-22]|uniref:hypothetical protein n=1 Tax=unclassified Streptomyces TaxID=2593676 RepID=UPI001BE9D7F5|nr:MULTISPECIES: hypothetical protein [unclassified Streptomyces]MBT2417049.1 hypothetical protein [Streptomyces sp. ISL-24]MBT2436099.1 hypothetical protein [Streptomyces sp. ISL-22]
MENTPRFVVVTVGKRPGFHSAVRDALTDLVRDSGRALSDTAPDEPRTGAIRTPAYTDVLTKARRFLALTLPHAAIRLVSADSAPQAARALEDRAAGPDAAPPLMFVDAAGAGLGTEPLDADVSEAFGALPSRNVAVYTEGPHPGVQMARPYEVLRLPEEPWVLTADLVRRFTDHVQHHHGRTALRSVSRTGPPALAAALHGFLTERAGDRWGLHYFTGSVVSGLITELDRLAAAGGNPVLRGPSEHSLACGALARWQLDAAPFVIVVTSGMVDEFRGTLANLRQARARGFLVCADSPRGAWFPLQGTVHAAEDSRAVLAARRIPYVYLEDPATLQRDLTAAFAAYDEERGPVVLLATPSVLASAAPLAIEAPRRPRPVLQVRDDQLAPVVDLVNSGPARLLWQCGPLDGAESGLVHDIAARAGIALADSPIHPGSVSGYRDGRKVTEYLGLLALYGYSARVHSYLHRGGRLRPRADQAVLFLKSRVGEVSTPFSPRALARGLRIAQVTSEAAHLAPFTDHPVHAEALPFLRALRERLDVDEELRSRRRAALAEARHSPDDAVHALPVLPMSANYFFHRLGGVLEELITTRGHTYTGVFDAGRGGMSAMRNLPRTGPGFSGWYGRALMGDALQAVPAVALTRDDNVLAFVGDGASALVPDIVPTLVQQVCGYGQRLRRNLTAFRLIDGGLSMIRSYDEGRAGNGLHRQNQVLTLLDPEWTRDFGRVTVRHRHVRDVSPDRLRDWLTRPATVNVCSVPLSHNNEGDGLSPLSCLGWQRDELSPLALPSPRSAAPTDRF